MGLTKPRAAQIFNLDYKQSTRVVTTTNITLSGGAPSLVDGVSLSLGDRVLVIAQTTGTQNGLYYVTTLGSGANGTWARTSDGNENGEIEAGMIVMVTEGVIYADTQWKLITDDPIIINTTALTFTQNYMANSISSGTSNVVVNSNANVTISSAGTANVLTVSNTGAFVSGVISATGNVAGDYILGNGSQLTGLPATYTNANVTTLLANLGSNVISGTGNITTTANISGNYILGNGSQLAGLPAGYSNSNLATLGSNVISTTGTITGGNITGANILTAGIVSATGNVSGGNLNVTGNIVDTGPLTIITSSNGNIGLAPNGTGIVTVSTQVSAVGNITGANILTGGSISATGNVTGGNIVSGAGTGGNITGANVIAGNTFNAVTVSASGNIIGSFVIGNGSQLTGLPAGYSNSNLATLGSNVISTTGTITGGNITGANILTGGLVSATGNITGNYILGNGSQLTGIAASYGNANVATFLAAFGSNTVSTTGNITTGNVLTGGLISATGNITSGGTIITGSGSGGSITGANIISGNTFNAVTVSASGNITGGNIILSGNIIDTSDLILTSSAANANIRLWPTGIGTIIISGNITNSQGNGVGNIGNATGYFNTVFARATSAQYADLAEMYCADEKYVPGTVVEFGGNKEVTISNQSHSTRVAGIVSTNPSYLMNATLAFDTAVEVALVGRVPCHVVGTIAKGDRLVSSHIPGVATALVTAEYQPGCIVGKALEAYNSAEVGTIEVAVGRT